MSIHSFIYIFISSFLALFPIVNPISDGLIVNGYLSGLNNKQRKIIIKKVSINCLFVGLISLLAGHLILLLFNLEIPVIQLAGGILICKTGLDGLFNSKTANNDKEEATDQTNLKKYKTWFSILCLFPFALGQEVYRLFSHSWQILP